jgi:hypothetical protein
VQLNHCKLRKKEFVQKNKIIKDIIPSLNYAGADITPLLHCAGAEAFKSTEFSVSVTVKTLLAFCVFPTTNKKDSNRLV